MATNRHAIFAMAGPYLWTNKSRNKDLPLTSVEQYMGCTIGKQGIFLRFFVFLGTETEEDT
jgi:hypothetical protein